MIPEDADKSAIFNVRDFVGDACKVCCRQIINFELIQSVDRRSHLEFDLPLPVSHLTTSIRIQPRSFANLYLELAKTAKFETFSNLLQTIWL